jgi:hypothetical protein
LRKDEQLDDLLQRLGIDDDEIDDLVFEDEVDAPLGGIKRMALVKVHTSNFYSAQTSEQHMRVAWYPAERLRSDHWKITCLLFSASA